MLSKISGNFWKTSVKTLEEVFAAISTKKNEKIFILVSGFVQIIYRL